MKKTYKLPSFFQRIIALINSNLGINRNWELQPAPCHTANYVFSSEIRKNGHHHEFATGIYRDEKKKVFIKTWFGRVKDLRYYALINEYSCNKTLYFKLKSLSGSNRKYRIFVPKILDVIETKNSLSLVYEYVEGHHVSELPLSKQSEILHSAYQTLQKLSLRFSDTEKGNFGVISSAFYKRSLPFIALVTSLSAPKARRAVLKASIECSRKRKFVDTKTLFLAHRDLDPQNFIVNNSNVYILDCERMAFTVPEYDLNYLSLKPHCAELSDNLFKLAGVNPNVFLQNYIAIQFSHTPDNPPYFVNVHRRWLQDVHG